MYIRDAPNGKNKMWGCLRPEGVEPPAGKPNISSQAQDPRSRTAGSSPARRLFFPLLYIGVFFHIWPPRRQIYFVTNIVSFSWHAEFIHLLCITTWILTGGSPPSIDSSAKVNVVYIPRVNPGVTPGKMAPYPPISRVVFVDSIPVSPDILAVSRRGCERIRNGWKRCRIVHRSLEMIGRGFWTASGGRRT